MKESNAMKWVRQVRDDIYADVKELNPKQRIDYLKEQSKKAKEIMGSKSPAKI